MRHVFVPVLVAALAATGLMFSTTAFADATAQSTAGSGAVAAEKSAGVLSIHDLSPQRTHQHSAPRAQFGRTPIRGHGHAFVSASVDRGWDAVADQGHGFARYRTVRGSR